MTENPTPFEIKIEPTSADYDPNDSRWIDQVNRFLRDLESDGVGEIRKDIAPVDGTKGGAEAIILALGSAGAITAAVEMFKAWLGRDRGRSMKITVNRGGEEETIAVDATGMSSAAVEKFMEKAIRD